MVRGYFFFIIAMLSVCVSFVCASDGPVAYWPLDGSAVDVSGNGYDGTLINDPVWTYEVERGDCLSFDGVEDYVSISGYQGVCGTAGRTVSVWIKTSDATGWKDIIGWGDNNIGCRWLLTIRPEGLLQIAVTGGYQRGTTAVNDGQWHHVAAVLADDGSPDTSEVKFYIDGIEESSYTTLTIPIDTVAAPDVQIGLYNYNDTSDRYFQGLMDDVRIYDRALSREEIIVALAGLDSGSGTEADPYQISKPEQLMGIGSNVELMDKHFVLTDDIVFDPNNNPEHVFTDALIAADADFSGCFDGAGHEIVNLRIDSVESGLGLFGALHGTDSNPVEVRDVILVNPIITGQGGCGPLADLVWDGHVEDCRVVGGDIYSTYGGVGGLVGAVFQSSFSNCSSSAHVAGGNFVGGLVGYDMGSWGASYFTNCVAKGDVSGTGREIGGLIGEIIAPSGKQQVSRVIGCSASGSVSGESRVGGLIGFISDYDFQVERKKIELKNSYATGDVAGQADCVGGLIGYNGTYLVRDCYALGQTVSTGGSSVGGLIGYNRGGQILNCFSAGYVSGVDHVGGLIGDNYLGEAFLCYWDTTSSQTTTSDGGTGLNTELMTSAGTYRGWGDDAWVLDAGNDYPHLAWEGVTGELIVDLRGYSGGVGTMEDPYQISTVADLLDMGRYAKDWDKCFELTNDIVLDANNLSDPNVVYENANFNKIGFWGAPFSGFFNGQFHRIVNPSHQDTDERYNGLFGFIHSGGLESVAVENLRVVNPAFAGHDYHGGLVGRIENAKIVRCGVEGFAIGQMSDDPYHAKYFGGLAGFAEEAAFEMSYAEGVFDSTYRQYLGGLIGCIYSSQATHSYAIASFSRDYSYSGGFAGGAWDSDITHCHAVPSTIAEDYYFTIAGFVRDTDTATVPSHCYYQYNDGIVSGDGGVMLYETEMQQQASFVGWDFVGEDVNGSNEIWRMCVDGVDYPRLSWEFAQHGDFACGDGVDFADLAALAEHWLLVGTAHPTEFNYACDANGDSTIDLQDFMVLSENW